MIARLIFLAVPDDKSLQTEHIWKKECTPLMVQQPGCLTHQFMRNQQNPGEFISLSFWASMGAIEKYGDSEARKEIQNYTRDLLGASHVEVKTYEVIG